ncbi:GSCOCG00005850001-RA-CDS, partial [Cotesia congregata]
STPSCAAPHWRYVNSISSDGIPRNKGRSSCDIVSISVAVDKSGAVDVSPIRLIVLNCATVRRVYIVNNVISAEGDVAAHVIFCIFGNGFGRTKQTFVRIITGLVGTWCLGTAAACTRTTVAV